MIKREMHGIITVRLKTFPAVAILGPRQVGKTTLAKTFSKTYFDLEQEEDRLKLDILWKSLIAAKDLIAELSRNIPKNPKRHRCRPEEDGQISLARFGFSRPHERGF
jgi:ATPase subunit of ABC transporter with duplicated ATPase domains